MKRILTPKDPGFWEIYHNNLPPGWQDNLSVDFSGGIAVRADTLGLQPMTHQELDEYLYGGEYDSLENYASSDTDI